MQAHSLLPVLVPMPQHCVFPVVSQAIVLGTRQLYFRHSPALRAVLKLPCTPGFRVAVSVSSEGSPNNQI